MRTEPARFRPRSESIGSLETHHPVDFLGLGTDEDHRYRSILTADFPTDIVAANARHHHIETHEVRLGLVE